jgi:hypothetical protein
MIGYRLKRKVLNMATQSGLALSLYEGNTSITCSEFVLEFALAFPSLPAKTAALYWQNKARRAKFGLPPTALPAEFKDVVAAATPKAPKAPKLRGSSGHEDNEYFAAMAYEKSKPVKFKKEVAAKTLLPDSELAKIKEANLARMKAVSAKTKIYTNVARPEGPGVEDFDADEARAEVTNIVNDLDSFKAPRFLSKAQLKAMI